MPHVRITADRIDPVAVLERVGDPEDGAAILFLGTVRNHANGRAVESLEYEAYAEMAEPVLLELSREGARRLGTDRVAIEHRVGLLQVGEVSVAIAVSSPHRAEAYEASRHIIEELKRRLPVWKKEGYVGGAREWVAGTPVAEP